VTAKPNPVTPSAQSIAKALDESVPLTRLRAAVQDSNARFDAIRPALPGSLAAHVRPGPLDAEGWSLLAANGAVAAKLRQLKPRLEDLLRERGWTVCTVRIKVSGDPLPHASTSGR